MSATPHQSRIVFLINDDVKVVRCEYNPEKEHETTLHKTMIQNLQEGELVVVETGTRHGFTVAKVVEVDIEPDIDAFGEIKWVVSRFDNEGHQKLVAMENKAIATVKAAEKARRKAELRESMFAHKEAEMKALALTKIDDDVVLDDQDTIEGKATES